MTEFYAALIDPSDPSLRYTLLIGVLSSVALGIVGSYVVARRISYIAAAISHCVLGGIGAAIYLQKTFDWPWCDPILGALVAAVVSAVVIGLVSLYAKQREDTVISAVWSIGMAVGLLLLAKAPVAVDPMSYLFGSILLISPGDLYLVLGLDAAVILVGLGFYNKFLALCFDEEFAELRGVQVKFYYLLLLTITALTVVLMVRIVGVVLIIALLTLPAAVASQFSRRLWQMMAISTVVCAVTIVAGIAVSDSYDLSCGPTIILLAGFVYLVVALSGRFWRGQ